MKFRHYTAAFIGIIILPMTAWCQTTIVSGSSFNMGLGGSSGTNTTVQSSAGEVLVGMSAGANTRTESGFLVLVSQRQAALAIDEVSGLPTVYALHQNYPNPFNPSTTMDFDLPRATDIRVIVYDLLGREVVRLVDQNLAAGYHQLVWNGRDRSGQQVPTGMYIVLMLTPEYRKSIKLLLLK